MRKHLLWASAALALLAAACGPSTPGGSSQSPSGGACVNFGAGHRAYVVVQHQSGRTLERCVGFDGEQISGEDLMKQSGIQHGTQTFAALGKAVCQVDNEPARFTECFPKDKPNWLMFVTSGGEWTTPEVGFSQINLKDSEALGWKYAVLTPSSPVPPPLPKRS